jgi:hypothetical protein
MYAFRLMNLIVHSMQPKQHWAQQQRMDRQQPPGADSNSFSLLRMNSNIKRIISMMATNNEPNAIDPRLYRTTLFADDNTGAHPNSCTQSLCHPQFQPSTSQKVPPQNCDSSANCTAKNGYSNCLEIQTREILDVVQESYCSFTSGPVVRSNGTSNGGETACNNELCCPEHTKNVVYNSPSNVFTMV